jgi:hypothetical protein
MTPSPKDTEPTLNGQVARATFRDFVQEQVRQAIRATFISRSIGTTAGVINDLPVPRTRGGFHTQLFDHYQRRLVMRPQKLDTLSGKCTNWTGGCRRCGTHRQHDRGRFLLDDTCHHVSNGGINQDTRGQSEHRAAPPLLPIIALLGPDHQNAERAHVPPFLTLPPGGQRPWPWGQGQGTARARSAPARSGQIPRPPAAHRP